MSLLTNFPFDEPSFIQFGFEVRNGVVDGWQLYEPMVHNPLFLVKFEESILWNTGVLGTIPTKLLERLHTRRLSSPPIDAGISLGKLIVIQVEWFQHLQVPQIDMNWARKFVMAYV